MAKNAALKEVPEAGGLDVTDPLTSLAGQILRTRFRSFESWVPRNGRSAGPEAIHELRITVRHLRVAFKLFKEVLPEEGRALRAELGWFSRAFGETRDLDVHAEMLRRHRKEHPEHAAAIARLETLNDAARATARERLTRRLESRRAAKLRADLAAFVEQDFDSLPAGAHSPEIAEAYSTTTRKGLKRLLKLGNKIGRRSGRAALHRVRIGAKRLRYQLGFFSDLYPEVRPLMQAAKRLQTTLGAYNDACIAGSRLRKQAAEANGAGVDADTLKRLVRYQETEAARQRKHFSSSWTRFERAVKKAKFAA